jgi:hypothetical protein
MAGHDEILEANGNTNYAKYSPGMVIDSTERAPPDIADFAKSARFDGFASPARAGPGLDVSCKAGADGGGDSLTSA